NQANRQLTPQQRQDAATVQDLLAALAKSPTAVFMQPFDFPENAPPAPRVALISRLALGITVDIPAISAMLQRGRSPNAPTARAAMNGEYLVILLGKPDISDLRKPAPDGGLAASPNF